MSGQRRRMRATRWLLFIVVLSLLPIPWLQGGLRHGTSRQLALVVAGEPVPTPSMRYLTVLGYYPLLQALGDQLVDTDGDDPNDLLDLDPPDWMRPVVNEPVATAIGLEAAGKDATVWLRIDGDDPDGRRVVLDRFNGRPIRTGADFSSARGIVPIEEWWFTTTDGQRFDGAPSVVLERMQLRWSTRVDAHTTGGVPFGHLAAVREPIRGLPVGGSHTMMVALAAWAHTAGYTLPPGVLLAGTGSLDPMTHTIGRIGGLDLKAKAANDDGVDVLLYPAAHGDELDGVRTPGMRRIPVHNLEEAIDVLRSL